MPPSQGCCSHDHDCEATDCGVAYSLYKHINILRVRCLNASMEGTCANVFKPWHDRLQPTAQPLRSNDGDPDLLIHIPFDGSVKLKGICVIGGTNGTTPYHLKAYINRDDIDFAVAADIAAVQSWDIQEDFRGMIEYPTQVSKFNGVHSLDLHFTGTYGADLSEIQFIGLKGEFAEIHSITPTEVAVLSPTPVLGICTTSPAIPQLGQHHQGGGTPHLNFHLGPGHDF